jgi:hypothetical protein
MKPFFKPEDFYHPLGPTAIGLMPSDCAEFANRILEERGVRVSGHKTREGDWVMESEPYYSDAYQALLVCIEELPKKECEHDPQVFISKDMESWYLAGKPKPDFKCKHCGIKLKATWSAE